MPDFASQRTSAEMIAHPGPYVLVSDQEHVMPMIPSGGTVKDVI